MTVENQIEKYVAVISSDATISRANLGKLVRAQEKNSNEATRISSGLAINLADLMANERKNDTVQFQFADCKSALRTIVESAAPKDMEKDGAPESAFVQRMMSQADDAIKIAIMLLTPEKTGFFAGYRKNDAGDFVSAQDYAAMTQPQQATHSPEIFWNKAKTFPVTMIEKAKTPTPTTKMMPKRTEMREAYSLHYGNRKLNANQSGLLVTPKDKDNQPLLKTESSAKDVMSVLDNLGNWLDGDNLLSLDDEKGIMLERITKLGNQIDMAIQRNAVANQEANQQEQREADKKEMRKAS